jgi:Asp-tRNA(Asn)/Glu-tRNA(Gln) amidotransferase A subunit family amidase
VIAPGMPSMSAIDPGLMRCGAREAAEAIASGDFSSLELMRDCFRVIAQLDLDEAAAIEAAREFDRRKRNGESAGRLGGVPVGIKDIFNLDGMPCQMGSPIWQGFTPGNDARVVHYLRMEGATFPGKTVTAEFAVHAPGPTENPHRAGFIPGTSSSGSAAAVAAYMVPVALGTQTAGSVIRPASYCGVYGFKPSFGVVPRTGMLKTTDSLDTVGWFARSPADLQLMFDIVRVGGRDFPIMEKAFADQERQQPRDRKTWRVAFVNGPKWADAPEETKAAVRDFVGRLDALPDVSIEQVDLPVLARAHDVHHRIYAKALAYYFKEEFRHDTLVSAKINQLVSDGMALSMEEYHAAIGEQDEIAHALDDFFDQRGYDFIVDMATASEAMEGLDTVDLPDHCLIWTLARLPAVSVPALTGPTGLPLGVQIVSRRYGDPKLLRFVAMLENTGVLGTATCPPPPGISL